MVGVLDSGLGGLSVLKEIVRLLPITTQVIYYADTANCPYGGRSQNQILKLTQKAVQELVDRGATVVVLACNTMTGAAITHLREHYRGRVKFVGMVPAVKPALESTRSGVVGVMATRATLSSDGYKRVREMFRGKGQKIVDIAGEGLVEMIEGGMAESRQCEDLLREQLADFIAQGGDTLVLGCTHYPFLESQLRGILGEGVTIINPAGAVARQLLRVYLEDAPLSQKSDIEGEIKIEFISSGGEAEREKLVRTWFGES